jgi:siroheme synthase
MTIGKVYLVGAGPGDPGLLTVRGLELLRNAPVIVYDQLVNPALLNEAGSQTIKIFVGKRAGRHCIAQE